MYPIFRFAWQLIKHRNDPAIGPYDTHVSQHICWPWDLDFWAELNNGRTLTLYDLGRIPMSQRNGTVKALKAQKWGMTIAGSAVRYRRRVTMFQKLEMRSRTIGFDRKFVYLEQSMWNKAGDCTSHAVFRSAMIDKNGIVAPAKFMEAMGHPGPSPKLENWIEEWSAAEDNRTWPPMQSPVPNG